MILLALVVAAAAFLGGFAALLYVLGWREERRTEARVQRRLRELRQINRDPGQGAGA